MKSKAIALFVSLGLLSTLGSFVTLSFLLFSATGRQPVGEMAILMCIALLPALILSGIGAALPIQTVYKKAIALGLILPALALSLFYGIAFATAPPR
jgi:hypothetical protein